MIKVRKDFQDCYHANTIPVWAQTYLLKIWAWFFLRHCYDVTRKWKNLLFTAIHRTVYSSVTKSVFHFLEQNSLYWYFDFTCKGTDDLPVKHANKLKTAQLKLSLVAGATFPLVPPWKHHPVRATYISRPSKKHAFDAFFTVIHGQVVVISANF